MNDKRMTILIASPNSYSDVFYSFLNCYRHFCPNSPYEMILSTNNQSYDDITVINNYRENDTWMDRMIPALKEIRTKYVLLMCDDCIIQKRINWKIIDIILDEMDEHSIHFCGLANAFSGKRTNKKSITRYVKKNRAYAKNLQIGIFEKSYLIDILGDGKKTPWQIEKEWLDEAAMAKSGEYYDDIVSCGRNVFHSKNGVLKGKWFYSVWKFLRKRGFLCPSEREIIPFFKEKKMRIFGKIGKIIPAKSRARLKRIASFFGQPFYSDK